MSRCCIAGGPTEPPGYIARRLNMWDTLMKKYEEFVAEVPRLPISIKLMDGNVKEGISWVTTPFAIALSISKSLAEKTVIAKVNDSLWDLDRPFEGDATLELLDFDNKDGSSVYWHSSAHILGEAMEQIYHCHLCYGPPIEEGFYYDMWTGNQAVRAEDYPNLNNVCKKIIDAKQPFERLIMKKEDLLDMFKYNEFKLRIIRSKITEDTATVYRCGPLIDLCRGPHVRHTGKVKALKITKNSSAYFEGKADQESLQRVYGISFPTTKQLTEWTHFQEEAARRDHRKIGNQQELFFFNEMSPGSCFFEGRGAHIYNTLIDFIRCEYWKRGFVEVITPNIYNKRLYEMSGHWKHYSGDLFKLEIEKEMYGLKPMNCPGHCLIFSQRIRSYKDLPLRFADFGVLHRDEMSGALSGLTRVRRFQQDDAHIFCREDQINSEIKGCLEFLLYVYGVLGFQLQIYLSTRPESFMGSIALWDEAEKQLRESLDAFGYPWTLNEGDGAFYGPKIDITVMDALRRKQQCGTIQLDFQLPRSFKLYYEGAESGSASDSIQPVELGNRHHPVIIHRAVLGSMERMISILTESYAGKWPFWLSPMQAICIPVTSAFDVYANKVAREVHEAGFCCDVDIDSSKTIKKKIRNAQLAYYNFIFVLGETEAINQTVNVRTRDNKIHGEHKLDVVLQRFRYFKESKCLDAEVRF